jgi:hypothetical protein
MARRPCIMSESGSCRSYDPGHNLHFIHARLVGEMPWGWRDGIVTSVKGGEVVVGYLEVDHEIQLWHHSSLATLMVGAPVQVHERYHALGGGLGCVNVVVTNGLGPVPQPDEAQLRSSRTVAAIVDLATGRGLPVDRPDPVPDQQCAGPTRW